MLCGLYDVCVCVYVYLSSLCIVHYNRMCICSLCVFQNRETYSRQLEQQLRGEIHQLKQENSHLVEQKRRERGDLEVRVLNVCTCEHDDYYLVTHGFRLYGGHCRQVAALYSDHYRQVAALYSDHCRQVSALYNDHCRQVAAIYSDHCRQVAALYSDHCRQVAAL